MGRKIKNYEGEIHGCWKVLKRDMNPTSKSHETFWVCECQNCGSISSVRKSNLDQNPKFCNHCKGEKLRSWHIGDKYGLLTIIEEGQSKGNHTYVKVQCDCGSDPFEVRLEHLKGQSHNQVLSCGCLTESAGEFKIRILLEKANINFQREYRIIDENQKVMYFDFVLLDENNNIIKAIEFDGIQHFEPIEYFGGQDAFINQQERDQRKADYCNIHHIFLQRIPYWDFENINLEMLLKLK